MEQIVVDPGNAEEEKSLGDITDMHKKMYGHTGSRNRDEERWKWRKRRDLR